MNWLISRIRFTAVILSMAFLFIGWLIFFPISKAVVRQQIRRIWTRLLIASTGARLQIKGEKLEAAQLKNTMIVSNHISWLDTVVMLRLCFVQYIGKIEMLRWPILSNLIKAGGTIFINRKNKKDLLGINQKVAEYLTQGATIGLYPEGKTSNGREILPFKAPLLEAAIMAKSKIYPVVLNYRKENNQLATEVTFAKVNWLQTVMNTLRLKNLIITATILPPISAADFSDRESLANFLHQQISATYHNV